MDGQYGWKDIIEQIWMDAMYLSFIDSACLSFWFSFPY